MTKVDDDRAFAFLSALQVQLDLYRGILDLNTKQHKMIEKNDPIGLIKIMESKQKKIDHLEEINTEYGTERALMENCKLGEFSNIDEELDRVLAEIENVLKELVERESRDVEDLRSTQKEHSAQMDHMSRGKRMVNAYKSRNAATPKNFSTRR